MGMLKEFRDFAVKGNAIDMAVGIVIGAAFGKIVTSLVNDIIMLPLGLLLGRMDFSSLAIHLAANRRSGTACSSIRCWILRIVAFAIFLVVKQMNRLKQVPAPATKECPQCCTAIPIRAHRCPNCTSELTA